MLKAPKGIDWANIPDIGTASTRELAERLGVTTQAVRLARQRLGMSADGELMVQLTPEEARVMLRLAQLAQTSRDAAVIVRHKAYASAVRKLGGGRA